MAITVDPLTDGDFTRINRADAAGSWTADGTNWTSLALNTASEVENTGCIEVRVDPGIGSLVASFGSRNLENVHLRMWAKLGQSISAAATYGARLIVGTETTHGSWIVYDEIKQVVVYNGWMMLVADPRIPFDGSAGTPPQITGVTSAGIRIDFVDGNGKVLAVADMLWEGNEVSIEGGTTGARATFAEWATDDESNGYGILRPVGGVYYMNAGAVFQGVGTATSYFEDANKVLIFEDLPVSGSLYKLRHVGNATGTNHFQLGTSSGSGAAKEGAGGGVIQAAGAAPFRIEAIDTNIDVAAYFGVTMLGPTALYNSSFRGVKRLTAPSSYLDQTTARTGPNLAAGGLLQTTEALGDGVLFGHDEKFYGMDMDLSIAKGGTWTGTWEYYDGAAWQPLTDVTDGTSNWTLTGARTVTWAMPDDWAKGTFDSDNRYWIRFVITSFTSAGGGPTMSANGCSCLMAGDIRWEDPAAEIVGGSSSGMGSIRLRNGAFLKKHTVDSSNAPAKHAAIDLGSQDPATDTFRDVTVQNCINGLLVKDYTRFFNAAAAVDKGAGKVGIPSTAHGFPTGQSITIAGTTNYNGTFTVDATSTANEIVITATFVAETFATTDSAVPNQTFNLRNILFTNNTKDIRVDYPATSTVVFNILEGGDTPTFDDVNTTGPTAVNTVTLQVQVNDSAGAAVEGARVRIENASTGALVSEGSTSAAGTFTDATFNYVSDLGVTTKVRLKGFKPFRAGGTITVNGLSVGVTFQTDNIVDLP
jgi:hypothetical protein